MRSWRPALALVLGVFVACQVATDSALSLLGGPCYIDSDCNGELVCVYQRCHEACDATRDCDSGRCTRGENGVNICQQLDDVQCALNSDCPEPLVCAVDGQCRNECLTPSDCVAGQVCAGGVCAEPDELDDNGNLPEAPMGPDGEGGPCALTSDCAEPLLCIQGKCLFQCQEDQDCPSMRCEGNHCVPGTPPCVEHDQVTCPLPPGHMCGDVTMGIQICERMTSGLTMWSVCQCREIGGMGGSGGTGVGGLAGAGGVGGSSGVGGTPGAGGMAGGSPAGGFGGTPGGGGMAGGSPAGGSGGMPGGGGMAGGSPTGGGGVGGTGGLGGIGGTPPINGGFGGVGGAGGDGGLGTAGSA